MIFSHLTRPPPPGYTRGMRIIQSVGAVYAAHLSNPQSDIGHYLPFLREHGKGNILEIGVRGGASTAAFLLGLDVNGGHLYSVDTEDCRVFAPHANWSFLRANSRDHETVFAFAPAELDVLFIDGDHSREGYTNDLHTYSKIVRPGGLIISHDIDTSSNPNYTIENGYPEAPSEAIREEYFKFAVDNRYEHYQLPGKIGMGVIVKG